MKRAILFIFLVFAYCIAFSQSHQLTKVNKKKTGFTQFSQDYLEYLVELEKYFSSSDLDAAELCFETFKAFWLSPKCTDDLKDRIIINSNLLLKKKAIAYPFYCNYLSTEMLFVEKNHDPASYDEWQLVIENMLTTFKFGLDKLNFFLEYTIEALKNNSMFKGHGVQWRMMADGWRFEAGDIQNPVRLIIDKMDLGCFAHKDCTYISNTEGIYYPYRYYFEGKGGKVDWTRAGFEQVDVYAELKDYVIEARKPEYYANNVNFYYKSINFDRPFLTGFFHDKLMANVNPENATFPSFESDSTVKVKGIIKGVDYFGGFTLNGHRILSKDRKDTRGEILFYNEERELLIARSRDFAFSDIKTQGKYWGAKIVGRDTEIKIQVNDSGEIYHPGLLLRYNQDSVNGSPLLRLIRTNEGLGPSAFTNTYHNMIMHFDQITWNLNTLHLDFVMMRGVQTIQPRFESSNLYDTYTYRTLQLADRENPLVTLSKFSKANKTDFFNVVDLVPYFNSTTADIRIKMALLAQHGFVTMDMKGGKKEEGYGRILPRMRSYLLSHRKSLDREQKDGDYDAIQMQSKNRGSMNKDAIVGSVDLNDLSLKIMGIDTFPLSKFQNIKCIPNEEQIVMGANRNFSYNGLLKTEFFEFEGENFKFDYDNFKFKMDSIAYLKVKIRTDTLKVTRPDGEKFWYMTENGDERVIDKDDVYITTDSIGKPVYIKKQPLRTRIENITGELMIDSTINKSGALDSITKKFPKFRCSQQAQVFYDQYIDEESKPRKIYDGIYDRSKFYFTMDPFFLEGLGNFTTNSWKADGAFVSNIFPEFKQQLSIQTDTITNDEESAKDTVVAFSLGFLKPMDTYKVYDGVGKVENILKLSNKGLHGQGKLYYLTSTTSSNDFAYFPEAMVCDAYEFIIDEKAKGKHVENVPNDSIEFADTRGEYTFVEWLPVNEKKLVASGGITLAKVLQENSNWKLVENDIQMRKRPALIMYNDQATLEGSTTITPNLHQGSGKMEFSNAQLSARNYKYYQNRYTSDSADFKIIPKGMAKEAFSSEDITVEIDYNARLGKFKSNGEGSYSIFHLNQYKVFMDKFIWNMDRDEILIGEERVDTVKTKDPQNTTKDPKTTTKGSQYISIHPDQDELSFVSYYSGYNLQDFVLRCYDVDSIKTADVVVIVSSPVFIREQAKMDRLENCQIIADSIERWHKFYKASVQIIGKKQFHGKGTLDYRNLFENDRGTLDTFKQAILFDSIFSDRNNAYAEGSTFIKSEQNFYLDNHFKDYSGRVELTASKKHMKFIGQVKLYMGGNCKDVFKSEPFLFEGEINPDTVFIPIVARVKNVKDEMIDLGVFSSLDSLYSLIFSQKPHFSHTPVMEIDSGFVTFNKKKGEFLFGRLDRMKDEDVLANFMTYRPTSCLLTQEGQIDLGISLGQVKLETYGSMVHDLTKNKFSVNASTLLNFDFSSSLLKIMVKDFLDATTPFPAYLDKKLYKNTVRRKLGEKLSQELYDNLSVNGGLFDRISDSLKYTFVFTDMQMDWDPLSKSYAGAGKFGIANILSDQIIKSVDCKILLLKRQSGDVLHLYFDLGGGMWYYFNYIPGTMFALSSNFDFNENLKKLKESDRKSKSVNDLEYKFSIAEPDAHKKFLNGLNTNPDDIKENKEIKDVDDNNPDPNALPDDNLENP